MAKFYIKGVYYSLADIRRLREMGLDPHKDKIDRLLLNPNYHPPAEVEEEVKKETKNLVEKKVTPEEVEQKAEEIEPEKSETVAVTEEPEATQEVVQATPEEVAEFETLTAERGWQKTETKERYQELKKKLKK